MGCGYGPQNIIDAFVMLAKEYEDAYGYNQGKAID
jgi:hypothetical protein